jgi:hypothetical protein
LFVVIIFGVIGYLIGALFYMIYGIACDTIILCFFRDKESAGKSGRAPTAPEPLVEFYEKFKKE